MKTVVFLMGSPASGKSTVGRRMFPDAFIIDPDEYKKMIPGYDPKNPGVVHKESSKIAEHEFQMAIRDEHDTILVDGTGSNAEKMIRRMTEARIPGWEVVLLYVVCPLAVCLARNEARERTVDREMLIQKFLDIRYAFDAVAPHADIVKVINNA